MSPAHVFEPTYHGIKAKLRVGAWPMGMRLEATKLADELGVSVTPVRDSLNRLVGERLVELWPGEGYRVARLGERQLRDLFLVNRDLLNSATVGMVAGDMVAESCEAPPSYPEQIARLFSGVAAASGNTAIAEAVEALNDRLHAARCLDPQLIADYEVEIETFEMIIRNGADPTALISWFNQYHQRRCELASDYVFRLETGPNSS